MESNELFNTIKLISKKLKEIFNPIQESEIISNFYISLLENQIYRIIFDNFFNNLTEENIKEFNLLTSDIENIMKFTNQVSNHEFANTFDNSYDTTHNHDRNNIHVN